MRYIIPSLLILLLSFLSYGQEETATSYSKKFSIGITLSPDIAYRTLKSDNSTAEIVQDLRDRSEVPKFGYTAGISLKYNLSTKFAFETGIRYSNKGYAFKSTALIYGSYIDPRYGFVYHTIDNAPTHAKIIYNFNYIDIPMRYILKISENKIKVIASAGINVNLLINTTSISKLEYQGGREESIKDKYDYNFTKINISPTIGAGINYNINEKFNISVEPEFRYGILKIINSPISAYLWNAGLNVTCYYSLK
jgi:hypothetical protein